jgi:cytosine/adenosine deaminase-related metal-dependent hydrolase
VAVGENESGQPPRDLGDVAILPGLVNAHTHLEYSTLEKPYGKPGMGFAQWIKRVVEKRRSQAKTLMLETDGLERFRRRAAEAGLAELRACGTAAMGDVATPGWPRECFPAEGISATIFLELLGLDSRQQDSLLSMAQSFVLDLHDAASGLRPGLSPHAPYTVSPELVELVCQLSAAERCAVTMHLAESREELELLESHTGPMVEVMKSLDAWHPEAAPSGTRAMDYLKMLAKAHRTLVIHGNYLAGDEIEFLAKHRERMSLVFCPRTHAYFGHEEYPLERMLAAGVNVAVGTDSRASNPDLLLLEELKHIARHHPQISSEAILRMGTLAGAEALGIASEYGSITPGKRAALAVVPLESSSGSALEAVLFSAGNAQALSTEYEVRRTL